MIPSRVVTLVCDSHGQLVRRRWILGDFDEYPPELTLKVGVHVLSFILAPELHDEQNGGATYCQKPGT